MGGDADAAFEHEPVFEGCDGCHAPHGAVANNLLVQNEPFLCLQCHQPHFHSILEGFEGDYGTPPAVEAADLVFEGGTIYAGPARILDGNERSELDPSTWLMGSTG